MLNSLDVDCSGGILDGPGWLGFGMAGLTGIRRRPFWFWERDSTAADGLRSRPRFSDLI